MSNVGSLIEHSRFIVIRMTRMARSLPALTWVTYRRQAFSKLRLLAIGFFLLVRIARLLFRTGARTGTA